MTYGKPAPAPDRFWAKVEVEHPLRCWLWTAYTAAKGYGRFWDGERPVFTHTWAYEHLIGPVPDGMTLDHLCRVPACVNPDHLEVVTPHVNLLRGTSPAALNARKTHCKRGHPLSGDNLYTRPPNNGGTEPYRHCRTCKREADRRYRREASNPGECWSELGASA